MNFVAFYDFVHPRVCVCVCLAAADLQGYRVMYSVNPELQGYALRTALMDNSTSITLGNLLANQTYYVRVHAFTVAGDGPPSNTTVIRLRYGGERSARASSMDGRTDGRIDG